MNKFLHGVLDLVKIECRMLCYWEIWISLVLWLVFSRLVVISLGNMIRRIRRIGMGTMTILNRNWMMEIAHRVNRSFDPQPLHQLVFHPPRIGIIRSLGHQHISLKKVFQAPRLTPLDLSVVITIQMSVSRKEMMLCMRSVWSQVEGLSF